MSFSKIDQVFPLRLHAISDAELAKIVAHALRHDFGETPSSIKHIGKLTGANLRTIKNWYDAGNVPSAGHLLLLARSSTTLLRFILEQIGGGDLWDAFDLLEGGENQSPEPQKVSQSLTIYGDNFVTISVSMDRNKVNEFNLRQLWFLGQVQHGKTLRLNDFCKVWDVTLRTAKRDAALLIEKRAIYFDGSKKTGSYKVRNN
jgi:hypothetical protein